MKVTLAKLIDAYLENIDEVDGWGGCSIKEGNSAETTIVEIQTFKADDIDQ